MLVEQPAMPRPITKERARITVKFAPSWEKNSIASVASMRMGVPTSTGNFFDVRAMMGANSSMPRNWLRRITPMRIVKLPPP